MLGSHDHDRPRCFTVRRGKLSLVMGLALVAGTACGKTETRHDVFFQGLQLEAAAEKGPCQLVYEEGSVAATLSGDQVMLCLKQTEEAIVLYERAIAMGAEGGDVERVYARAKERKQRLESMLKMVRKMERGQS